MLSWSEIETRAIAFSARWRDCTGAERQNAQTFEKDFMQVFGIDWHDGLHEHPIYLPDGSPGYVDYLLPGKILIEMKTKGKSLPAAYTQAMSYVRALKPEEVPALVMVSDFDQIQVYSLKKDHPYKPFRVRQLKNSTRIFSLIAGYGAQDEAPTEIEVNVSASYKMARIHDVLRENGYTGHELEIFLVRLLFCLFAEDTGIFEKESFQKYIEASNEDGSGLSGHLNNLFWVLNTPEVNRMKTLSDDLRRFRYINGSIFRDSLPPASFDRKMRETLIAVSRDFDWTQISPSIFGAMFQGVMDQEARRALGAHYTSQENILKVIRPLFLDELYDDFEKSKATTRELKEFQERLASLTFLDPACGSGNFLIVTFQELRKLEFEVLKLLNESHQMAWVDALVKVKPGQFYGIEIEDFPCQVAQLSMLLMKHLMDREVGDYFGVNIIDFPIRENANIVQGNALRMDWNEVCPAEKLSYIIGNPPFVGIRHSSENHRDDLKKILSVINKPGSMDYVTGWYILCAQMMQKNRNLECALVSTNSITQGDQVYPLWNYLINVANVEIKFAYTTFKWANEARNKAAVHCVIIGLASASKYIIKRLFTSDKIIECSNIHPYLISSPTYFVSKRSKPISCAPPLIKGCYPTDDGNYIFREAEMDEFIKAEPLSARYFRRWIGSEDMLNNQKRFILFLRDCPLSELKQMRLVQDRVKKVQEFRRKSTKEATRKKGDTPLLLDEERIPATPFIVLPVVSSENREYIPIGYFEPPDICYASAFFAENITPFHFGIITSNVHMAWMRTVSGRLKSDYRYSNTLVYNTFIWPECSAEQEQKISMTASKIVLIRGNYLGDSLADLYDPVLMPSDLRRAHQANDRAVWEAYGSAWSINDEAACVAHLMKLYQDTIKKDN